MSKDSFHIALIQGSLWWCQFGLRRPIYEFPVSGGGFTTSKDHNRVVHWWGKVHLVFVQLKEM